MAFHTMRIAAGSRLGRYEILAFIGAGGMGEVYKARDERLHRTVALKVLRADCCGHPEYQRRFASEAEVLARLNHPRICAIYDVGTTDGVDFFVMEYLEGQSLASLARKGGAPIREAARYALEIAEALAAAHRHGLVHRDLKPSNVFVTRTGAKLLDFGLARVATLAAADLSTTAVTAATTPSGVVLGTPAYIAPEVLRGDEADARSDLFAYGAVLFEILTGQAAFKGATAMDVVAAVLDQDAPRAGTLVPGIPPMLERLVANCLEKHPHARWQSAHDAVLALRDLQYDDDASTGAQMGAQPAPQRLTFQRGSIYAARFAPEGTNVLYSAAWNGMPTQVYLTRPDSPESKALGLGNADLLAVSASGTLAILQQQQINGFVRSGVLAQVHLAGAQPRTLATDILDADWTRAPERLLVVRRNSTRCQLEWPIGRVVYESDGLISHPRSSRDDQAVAFIDHPRIFDDSGAVVVIDHAGNRRELSGGWSSIWGLAWSKQGQEVWFTAAKGGTTRSLRAVTLSGEERVIAHTTGALTLHDIGVNGEVLISEDSSRGDVLFRSDDVERQLTWLDGTYPRDLSADGTMLLFDETGDGGGPAYSVYLRSTDGGPAVRLGDGFAATLSPDKRWAAMIPRSMRGGIPVVPTGPGEPMLVADGTLEEYRWLAWLPDGQHVVCNAAEPGRGLRLFVHRLGSAGMRAISPENMLGPVAVAPDGRHVIGVHRAERSAWVFPLDAGRAPQLIPQITPEEMPFQWSDDGAAVYLRHRGGEMPLRVSRLELTTGEKRLWREFTIADRAGVQVISSILLTPDGRHVALVYRRVLSDLFLFAGLS
jgi:serine/threonine protein kinase